MSISSAPPSVRQSARDLSDRSALDGNFSKEEQAGLLEKAKTVLSNDQFRQGFKDSVYFVDSGGPLPHRIQCIKSGKCTCDCNFFGRNNLSHHCLAIGIHLNCVANIVKAYGGQNLSTISAATAPKNTGGKAPSRKRSLPATEVVEHHSLETDSTANETNFEAEAVNPTTLVIRRAVRPVDPPPSGPLVVKRIAGCWVLQVKAIKSSVVGFAFNQMALRHFLPECTAPRFTRVLCATNNTRMSHRRAVVLFRGEITFLTIVWPLESI